MIYYCCPICGQIFPAAQRYSIVVSFHPPHTEDVCEPCCDWADELLRACDCERRPL